MITNGTKKKELGNQKQNNHKLKKYIMSTKFYLTVIALVLCLMFAGFAHGQTWTQIPNKQFSSISFLNNTTGYASENKNDSCFIYKTTNKGLSWVFYTGFNNSNIYQIKTIDTNLIYIVNREMPYGDLKFNKYQNRNLINLWNFNSTNCVQLHFVNPNIGFIILDNYITFKTSDSGSNWTNINKAFRRITSTKIGLDSTKTMAVMDDHYIYYSFDFGNNWSTTDNPGDNYKIIIMNGMYGFCTSQSYIYKTTNYGNNWTQINSIPLGNNITINDITFKNSNLIYCSYYAGTNKISYMTSSNTWATTTIGTNAPYLLYPVSERLFAYKENYQSYFLNDSLLANITSPVVKSYSLFTSYPNPFNSQTTIKYSVIKKDNVKIDLFDISGKYISTIVNQMQNPGTYTANVNMNTLSSGIYFAKYNDSVIKLTLVK